MQQVAWHISCCRPSTPNSLNRHSQVPLQVDRQHGDAQHWLIDLDQPMLQLAAAAIAAACLCCCLLAYQHPACKAKVSVKPGVPQAASVGFYVDSLAAATAALADWLHLQQFMSGAQQQHTISEHNSSAP